MLIFQGFVVLAHFLLIPLIYIKKYIDEALEFRSLQNNKTYILPVSYANDS